MKPRYLVPLFFLVLALGVSIGLAMRSASPSQFSTQPRRAERIGELLDLIERDYFRKVDVDSLLDEIIAQTLHSLDPHSDYLSGDRLEESSDDLHDSFGGIGIEFSFYRDTLIVLQVVEGGPAQKAGIEAGDRIFKVDGEPFGGSEFQDDWVRRLKGVSGSLVRLDLRRVNSKNPREIELRRGRISNPSVSGAAMLSDRLGYVRIERFAESTHRELRAELERLLHLGMRSLVLDLRGNPGGLMAQAQSVADEFLASDLLIVRTVDRDGNDEAFHATSRGLFEVGELAVLLDQESASASEVVAGALQDHKRAIVVGRRSFGKGLVQEEVVLNDGSVVRLTAFRYYTPSGKSLQRSYSEGLEEYYSKSQLERYSDDGENSAGIRPDYFVSDTLTSEERLFYGRVSNDSLYLLAFRFWDQQRQRLKTMGSERWMNSTAGELKKWDGAVFRALGLTDKAEANALGLNLFKKEVLNLAYPRAQRSKWMLKTDPDVQKAGDLLIKSEG